MAFSDNHVTWDLYRDCFWVSADYSKMQEFRKVIQYIQSKHASCYSGGEYDPG